MTITALDSAPGNQWTGFVLVVIPVSGTGLDADKLHSEVAEQLENDVVLQDTLRVGISGDIKPGDERATAPVIDAIARTASYRDGALFAPRAVFGCVVIGPDVEQTERAMEALARSATLRRLQAYLYGVVAKAPPGRHAQASERVQRSEGVDGLDGETGPISHSPLEATATKVLEKAVTMMESFERAPSSSVSSQEFTAIMNRPAATPAVSARASSPRRHANPRSNEGRDPSGREVSRAASLLTISKPRKPSQAQALDLLTGTAEAAALVYIVAIPDRVRVGRQVRRRRADLIVEVDRALDNLRIRAGRGVEPIPIEVGLMTAGRRLHRHGPLRLAGSLEHGQVPKVSSEHLDLVSCVDDLLEIHRQDSASLRRRGVALSEAHAVFVSTSAPLADTVSIERFEQLSSLMQIDWILLTPDQETMSEEFAAAGVVTFREHLDVANEVATAAFGDVADGSL